MIAIKRHQLDFVKFLFEKGVDYTYLNKDKLNCLDVAILNNQYKCALFIYEKNVLELKPMEEYLNLLDPRIKDEILNDEVRTGKKIFNLPLFYETLRKKENPKDTPLFLFSKKVYIGNFLVINTI